MGSVDEIRVSCRGILENEDGSAETICRGLYGRDGRGPSFPALLLAWWIWLAIELSDDVPVEKLSVFRSAQLFVARLAVVFFFSFLFLFSSSQSQANQQRLKLIPSGPSQSRRARYLSTFLLSFGFST